MTVWVVLYTNAFEEYDNPIYDIRVFRDKPDTSNDRTVLDVYEVEIEE